MKVFVDQSGKIEETQRDTVLAFSNKEKGAIRIKAKTKRLLQKTFRLQGRPRIFVYKVFSVGVFILVRSKLKNIRQIIIDREYPGQENLIKEMLLSLIGRFYSNNQSEISFANIGKNASAHKLAFFIFKRKVKGEKIINFEEIIRLTKIKRPRAPSGT